MRVEQKSACYQSPKPTVWWELLNSRVGVTKVVSSECRSDTRKLNRSERCLNFESWKAIGKENEFEIIFILQSTYTAMIPQVFSLYSLLKTTQSQNVMFMFFKDLKPVFICPKLSEMRCCDGGIASFAACKLQILRHPVPSPSLQGACSFLQFPWKLANWSNLMPTRLNNTQS